jgi:hypothetical protein
MIRYVISVRALPSKTYGIFCARHSAQIIPTLEPHLRQAAIDSYADALRVVFICQAAVSLLGVLATLPIQEGRLSYVDFFSWHYRCD